ncbi:helix-turn-helix domain-containing protein [Rhizobium croatiense]|uniref:helix-turn-helix domain-containing protein n=1 Tax=Rhizobium croatiense TaxID=2867516 RepID=UPI001FE9D696|nr:LysR family transcriptional regulator [Rhizobium croatiense]
MTGRIPMVSLIQTLAVAEHLNFRYAANVLGVTQSSVSSRVKALEATRAAFRTTASRRPAHRNRIFARDGAFCCRSMSIQGTCGMC